MSNIQEIWKHIKGYEGLYLISNLGRVKSLPREKLTPKGTQCMSKEKFLKTNPSKMGYPVVMLSLNCDIKLHKLHRLIAIAFIPNIENKPFINHKDGNKLNNSLDNLEWCTAKENIQHAFDTGLRVSSKGENQGSSKLTAKNILEIRERLKNGEKQSAIARAYNVHKATIWGIKNNITWSHILP